MGFFDFSADTIGIDPGSAYLRIIKDNELVFDEPTALAFDRQTSILKGIGNAFNEDEEDCIIRPVDYAIADFHAFEELLRKAKSKGLQQRSFFQKVCNMYFAIPTHATEVEKRAYRDSGQHAGAKEVYLILQNYSAALGMGVLFNKHDFILIDFSASKVEISIFADNINIATRVTRFGLTKLKKLIRNRVYRNLQLQLSYSEIEAILQSLTYDASASTLGVQKFSATTKPVQEVLDVFSFLVKEEVTEALEQEQNHPNMSRILGNGVYFTGGGTVYRQICRSMTPPGVSRFYFSPSPFHDCCNGLKKMIADKKKYQDYIQT